MSSARRVELVGVVVRVANFGEADRIVELLTAEHGRVSLLARGGRASRRRFAGALDLFESLRVQAQARGELWTLLAADVLAVRLAIRSSLAALDRAARLVAVARRLANEHEASVELYAGLTWGLDRLADGALAEAALAYPRLLAGAGIGPEVERCACCGGSLTHGGRLAPVHDGVVCVGCGASPSIRAALWTWPAVLLPEPGEADLLEADVVAWVEEHTGRSLRCPVELAGRQR